MTDTWTAQNWDVLNRRLDTGHVTPVLGAGASIDVVGSAVDLAAELATACQLPFTTRDALDKVAQYAAIDRDMPGEQLAELLRVRLTNLRVADRCTEHDIYRYLTAVDIPVWLTTNYDDMIKRGLAYNNTAARVSVALWTPPDLHWDNGQYDLGAWEPSTAEPLVFHLHGRYGDERSMVITENDYLEYLEQMARDQGTLLPACVRRRLNTTSLLFVGYSFNDPNFHLLLRQWQTPKQCYAVQPAPFRSDVELAAFTPYYERRLRELTQADIKVFWGTATEFCAAHEESRQ